ncbi:MAG: ATP-binding protein [Clostridia bacterium]|nr:ATP-binding protein [Clostridia bacterium]
MGYSAEVVKSVRDMFEKKRADAENLSVLHLNEVALKNSEILSINKALSLTGLMIYEAAIKGPEGLEERIEKIKRENHVLIEAKQQLLCGLGYPEDYLDIKYSCDKCNDTGYEGINMCSCMKKALVKEAYAQSGLGKFLKSQTFKTFDLSFYEEGEEREQMAAILEKAKKYVSDFGKPDKDSNLLFVGTTGLGKTHITTAIAKGVIDKAYGVVYDSAQNIIRAFENEHFEKDEKASREVQRYFDCDLLIIDDLGTEFRNSFTQSCIYNLLNTRINAGKCMIISTNIDSTSKLRETYDDRIFSRLIGSFRHFKFVGKDIRIAKMKNGTK